MESIPVALEIGPKRRVFAQALDWIGWCRVGKDEVSALNQLVIVGSLYAQVAERAGLTFTAPPSIEALEVVERMPGTATTDFGAPAVPLTSDQEPLTEADIELQMSLLTACWATFDNVLRSISADLHDKKPERGRSPSAMRLHLLETDRMHLSAFGPAFPPARSGSRCRTGSSSTGTDHCGAAGNTSRRSHRASPQVWLHMDSTLCGTQIGVARARSCLGTSRSVGQVKPCD